MEPTEVFILRIWREAREIAGAPAIWRGVIQHVPTGERRFIQNFADLREFVARFTPWGSEPEQTRDDG